VKNGNSIIHFDSIEEALKDFAEGKFVLVVDNEERENEGDLIIAAEKVTAEKMAFMIKYTRKRNVTCEKDIWSATDANSFDTLTPPLD
ncbi:4824_t:CDS:2, partial [Entrophospora sp. SA101]